MPQHNETLLFLEETLSPTDCKNGKVIRKKHTITLLNLVGLPVLIIAVAGFGPDFTTQLHSCQSSVSGCISTASPPAIIGFVLSLMGAIPVLIGWIMGLIKQPRSVAGAGLWANS